MAKRVAIVDDHFPPPEIFAPELTEISDDRTAMARGGAVR